MKSELTIDTSGTKRWKLPNGDFHREDGPALEYANGNKSWWINGLRHRENDPAVEHIDGYKAWYINGKLHRENSPALELINGEKWWYINGTHREDGPAIEGNNNKYWYINGKKYTEQEYKHKMRSRKLNKLLK